ncbi:MAG: cell envelope integrity protein TolA [Steroidobacteraceae bacterium]
MSVAIRPRLAPFGWSVALHVAIAGLLVVKFALPEEELPPQALQIEAVIVNQAVLQAAASLRKEDLRRQQRQDAEEREERERVARIENDKRADEQHRLKAEQAEQQKEKAAAEAQRKAEEDAKRKAAAVQKRKTQEARLKAERELELRARLAEEEERTGAAFQGLKAQYVAAIQAHVERRWFKPPGTPVGANCITFVTQIPGGEVVAVRFGTCGGGEAFRQSIENAIRNASPLPAPLEASLFEREVRLVFRAEE